MVGFPTDGVLEESPPPPPPPPNTTDPHVAPLDLREMPEPVILNPDPSDPIIDDWDLGRPSGEYYDIIPTDPSDPVIDDWDLGWPSMEPSTDPGTIGHDVQDQDAFFFEGF